MAVNDFIVKNGLFVSTTATILGRNRSTSTTTGALVVNGGVGIGQDLYVGGTIYGFASVSGIISTATNINGGTAGQVPYQSSPGSTNFTGGAGTAGNVLVSNGTSAPTFNSTLTLASTNNATSTQTGALQVVGGTGIGQNLYVGGYVNVASTTTTATINVKAGSGAVWADAADFQGGQGGSDNSGAVIYVRNGLYGAGQGGKIYGGRWGTNDRGLRLTGVSFDGSENSYIHLNSEATTIRLNVGGIDRLSIAATGVVTISTSTNATTTATGALVVTGGAGFGQDVYIGGDLAVNGGDLTSAATTFNLVNATVTTLNFAGAATAITIGAVSGVTTIRNATTVSNSTNATSTTTGALQVVGGVGIGQNLYVGGGTQITGRFTSTGIANITNTTDATSTQTGALQVAGGVGIGQNLYVGGGTQVAGRFTSTGIANVTNNTDATSTQTGALVVTGGAGIGQNLYVGGGSQVTGRFTSTGIANVTNTTDATSTSTGALVVTGGVGIGQNLYVGGGTRVQGRVTASGIVNILNTTGASSTVTGALVVSGGVGIGENLYVNGDIVASRLIIEYTTITTTLVQTDDIIKTTNTTNATTTQTGALQISGGAGIGQNLYVGGDLNVTGIIVGTVATSVTTATTLNTQQRAVGASYFLTFVDSNNSPATPEIFYTSATIKFDPTIGLAIGGTGAPTATLDVTGGTRISGLTTVSNTTNASSTITGALQVLGGAGIGGDLFASRIRTVSTTNATNTTTGEIVVRGGMGIGQDVYIGGSLQVGGATGGTITGLAGLTTTNAVINGTTNSTSTVTGALVVSGGVGIGQNIYVGGGAQVTGITTVTNTTNATTTQSGALVVAGGAGIGQNLWIGGTLAVAGITTLSNQTNATSTTSGAVRIAGGVGVGGDIFASRIRTVSTTNSTNTTTGEIVVQGGVGIGQDLYVGGVIYGQVAGASTTATNVYVTRASTATQYYITFVDSNNAGTTTPEVIYTSATISFNPGVGFAVGSVNSATAMLDVSGTTRISGITTVSNTTNASSTITGAFQVLGGAGIGGDLYASRIRTVSTTNATSTTTGEIVVGGGVGIGQNLYVGGNVFVTGTIFASNINSTGTVIATVSTSTTSNNILGGAPLQILFQSNTSTTGFIQSPLGALTTSTSTVVLYYTTATGFTWSNITSLIQGLALDPIIDTFVATGNTTTFALSTSPRSKNHIDVNIDGVDQLHSAYSLVGNSLILTGTPAAGANVEVTIFTTTVTNFVNGPAGPFNSIQYNNGGTLGGALNFFYASTGVNLTVTTNAVNTQSGALQVSGGVGIGQNLYVGGGVGITGVTTVTNNTNATSSLTGALQVVGGVGIQGDLYARNIYSNGALVGSGGGVGSPFSGIFTITNTTQATSTTTGALQVYGGAGIGGNLHVGGDIVANRLIIQFTTVTTQIIQTDDLILSSNVIQSTNTTNATSTTTGTLVIAGGAGIGQNLYVGGNLNVTGTINGSIAGTADNVKTIASNTNASYFPVFVDTNNSTAQSESLYTSATITFNPFVGLRVANTTSSISSSTGALQIVGGIGVGQDVYIAGNQNATSTLTGALQVVGGAGVGQNLYVGGNLVVTGGITGSVTGNVTTTTNIGGGTAGQVPYQTGPGATSFFGPGTAGNVLVSNGTAAPSYNNTLTLAGTTNATSTQTGALQVRGGVGVGGQVYASAFTAFGAEVTDGSMRAQVTVISTGTFTNTPTAGIAFGAYFTGTGIAGLGGITVSKNNNISGDLGSYLSLHTRNSSTQITEAVRITDTSTVIIYGGEQATSTSTGVLRVPFGGVGIGGNLYVGGNTTVTNNELILGTTNATSTLTGALQVRGGVGIGQNLHVGGTLTVGGSAVITTGTGGVTSPYGGIFTVTNTTNAGNTQSGAVQVYGGIGVGGNVNVGGVITATNLFVNGFAVSTTSGAISNPFSGVFTITNTTQSFSTNTGALQVYGGVGIGGNLYATSKSFSIAHPTRPGLTLNYGSLEGPEFGVYVRGTLKNTNVIVLPDYWIELVDENSISVNITPRGRSQDIYVESIANNQVHLHGENIDCYFIVYGERKDIDKIVVER